MNSDKPDYKQEDAHNTIIHEHVSKVYMSCVLRKPAFCIYADQLHVNRSTFVFAT